MTVGKISAICWTIFVVMCVAFGPALIAIVSMHGAAVAITVVVFILVWWMPFGYAMYLSLAVVRNGDRRLLKRGTKGTAEVLSAKRTNETIQEGEFAWEAPRVWKYRLRVTIPGRRPYETDCRICAAGIREGSVVHVAASPHNHKRVTIDVGQKEPSGGAPRARLVSGPAHATPSHTAPDHVSQLTQLAKLHRQGDLTDAEFAAEKARLLSSRDS